MIIMGMQIHSSCLFLDYLLTWCISYGCPLLVQRYIIYPVVDSPVKNLNSGDKGWRCKTADKRTVRDNLQKNLIGRTNVMHDRYERIWLYVFFAKSFDNFVPNRSEFKTINSCNKWRKSVEMFYIGSQLSVRKVGLLHTSRLKQIGLRRRREWLLNPKLLSLIGSKTIYFTIFKLFLSSK